MIAGIKSQIPGFSRPYKVVVSSANDLVVLSRSPEQVLFILFSDGSYNHFKMSDLGIQNPEFLSINNEDQIFILDSSSGVLHNFDIHMRKLASMKLPGREFGSMIFSKEMDSLYLSVIEKSEIISIKKDVISKYFDYSQINQCNAANAIAVMRNRLMILNSSDSSLFDIELTENNFSYKKYLSHGRGGNGKVRNPTDINVCERYIVINDNHNYMLQFFDHDMNFEFQIGSKGNDLGYFDLPIDSCFKHKHIYICDMNNDRIITYNIESNLLGVETEREFIPGFLNRPSGVTHDQTANIYVADRSSGFIQRFNKEMEFIDLVGTENLNLQRPSSISFFQKNQEFFFAIIERRYSSVAELGIFSSKNGELVKNAQSFSHLNLNDPQDMEVTTAGEIIIADTLNRRIIKVDLYGNLIGQIDMASVSGNERILVKCISIREDNHIFTADFNNCVVYHFDEMMTLKRTIDFSHIQDGIKVIRSLLARNDELILCVRGNNQVIVSNYQGEIVNRIEISKKDSIGWRNPVKVHQMLDEEVIICDKENDRLLVFDRDLESIKHISKSVIN